MNLKNLSLASKLKHMLKNEAPAHEFLYRLFPVELYWFTTESCSLGYHPWVKAFITNFFKTVWVSLSMGLFKLNKRLHINVTVICYVMHCDLDLTLRSYPILFVKYLDF